MNIQANHISLLTPEKFWFWRNLRPNTWRQGHVFSFLCFNWKEVFQLLLYIYVFSHHILTFSFWGTLQRVVAIEEKARCSWSKNFILLSSRITDCWTVLQKRISFGLRRKEADTGFNFNLCPDSMWEAKIETGVRETALDVTSLHQPVVHSRLIWWKRSPPECTNCCICWCWMAATNQLQFHPNLFVVPFGQQPSQIFCGSRLKAAQQSFTKLISDGFKIWRCVLCDRFIWPNSFLLLAHSAFYRFCVQVRIFSTRRRLTPWQKH